MEENRVNNLKTIIELGENVTTEFKTANEGLPKNIFETVCAFSNTIGGDIILGVNDEREIMGVDGYLIDKIKKEFSTKCNNGELLNPTIISNFEEIKIDGKTILYTHIKETINLCRYKNRVYIRNYEGDFDITDNMDLVTSIYNQKMKIFDEDTIYPYINIEEDLRIDLIDKARKLANSNIKKRHIWMDMSDIELLKSAGLYKYDALKQSWGVTLAGIMLFGKDDVIWNTNPYCRTDAIYRVDDLDRYDDRDLVETNLIEMYDRLIDFER